MPSILPKLGLYISTLRALGSATAWRSLRHRARYSYWQRAYAATGARAGDPQYLGRLLDYRLLSGDGPSALQAPSQEGGTTVLAAQVVDLRCEGGVLRIEFLGEGIGRVRLSRSGVFPALVSYAVAGAQDGGPAKTPMGEPAPGGPLRLEGPGLIVEVSDHPCRLTFKDTDGRILCADAAGAGWQDDGVVCSQRLFPGQALYGLGEKAFGLNRRGLKLTLWNTDPRGGYDPGDDPIYQSTPFLLGQQEGVACGVLFDNTYRAEFDLGQTDRDQMQYWAAGGELCYYVFAGPTMADVLKRFTALTGRVQLPARWTLGYHQSRWSYGSADEVEQVAGELRARRIPCDALYLDIDYMDGYRVFTWDRERFPDPARMIADLRERGIRIVTIVDPGVKVDPGYAVCADGLAKGVFCKLPDGKPFVGPVWPGDCYFPDFTNAAARDWWGNLYQTLLDIGVAGFWNDMNEPAVFPNSTFPDAVQHDADRGPADHRTLHNVYGQCMLQAARASMDRNCPDERMLLISRSGYAGIQRYGITWTGDNHSTWEHLRVSIAMVANMGLSGQAITGPDVAGFTGDTTGELLVRWMQMGIFLPLFRNHSAMGTALQEPYVFGEPYESICRRYIELRYRLMPYIYTAFWQAAETGIPITRPLALPYPHDRRVASLDDQCLFGDALMAAPVMEEGAEGRGVYLPEGEWFDFWTGQMLVGPADVPAHAPLESLPLYARAGSVVTMGPVMQHTEEFIPTTLELHVFAGSSGTNGDGAGELYEDDGHSMAYRQGAMRLTHFDLETSSDGLELTRHAHGSYDPGYLGYDVLLRGLADTLGEQIIGAARASQAGGAPPAGAPPGDTQPEGGKNQPARLTVVVDGAPVTNWTIDEEWGAPRIPAGMFERLEAHWT